MPQNPKLPHLITQEQQRFNSMERRTEIGAFSAPCQNCGAFVTVRQFSGQVLFYCKLGTRELHTCPPQVTKPFLPVKCRKRGLGKGNLTLL